MSDPTHGPNSTHTHEPNESHAISTELCASLKTCNSCINHRCLWCASASTCLYSTPKQLVTADQCPMTNQYRFTCKFSNQTGGIAFLIVFGVLMLMAAICWCRLTRSCCYDRKQRNERIQMEEAKFEEDRATRRVEAEGRRNDRRKRMDVIRQKYGLAPKNPYQVMDDDTEL